MPAPSVYLMRRLARERFHDFVLRAPRRAGQARSERFIDEMCRAICAAWLQWQSQAELCGAVAEGALLRGGKLLAPSLEGLILARAPRDTPWARQRAKAIAGALGAVWSGWVGSLYLPGLPAGMAPLRTLGQSTACLNTMGLLSRMALAMPGPLRGLDSGMLESLAAAFVVCFRRWHASTTVSIAATLGSVGVAKSGVLR